MNPWWKTVSGQMLLVPFVAVLLIGTYLLLRPEPSPYQQIASETNNLLSSVTEIQNSFNKQDSPALATSQYLLNLKAITKSCKNIYEHEKVTQTDTTSLEQKEQIKQTIALCQDLDKIVDESLQTYSALRPLLSSEATPVRFQYYPPFKGLIRSRHEALVKDALEQIKKNEVTESEFPTSAYRELQAVQEGMESSQDLSYLPPLSTFQSRLLGERQQYWTAYADIASLLKSLQNQVDNYCKAEALKNCELN
jgi:hypothetical protein